MMTLSVALTGNPNTGKTTIFNELTGSQQKVGNWPGVTVDKKIGYTRRDDRVISVVDLPGIYSLTAHSLEEQIVCDYLAEQRPDVVLNVIDATNLSRNLFLTIQLLERDVPVILNLNMMDEAQKRGYLIHAQKLESSLGMPVVETVARDHDSTEKLLDVFTNQALRNYRESALVKAHKERIKALQASGKAAEVIEEECISLRYALIDQIMTDAVGQKQGAASYTESLDRFLANGFVALPLLLAMMYLIFEITFSWIGQPMADFIDGAIVETITPAVRELLVGVGVAAWLESLVVDGIIAGVGGVLTFVPLIFTLFFCLSFLDGTGYMARTAFVMDPIMRRTGLSGKGIMPMIMGFGCAVPAIMGAKALDSDRDRKIAIMVTPFLTCGAKLPIMALFAALFFPEQATNVVFSIYVIGIVVAVLMAKVLSKTMFKQEDSSFLLELPPYRMPDMNNVLRETWEKGKGFLIKAGTIIFMMSILIWFLGNYHFSGQVEMSHSFLADIGYGVAQLFAWHGFATWEAGAAVITGILAKEAVISTIGILYGVADMAEEASEAAVQLTSSVGASFTALSAYTFMIFAALYTPCMTVLGTIYKELGGIKWMAFAAIYSFGVAWLISLLVYQGGRMMGFS